MPDFHIDSTDQSRLARLSMPAGMSPARRSPEAQRSQQWLMFAVHASVWLTVFHLLFISPVPVGILVPLGIFLFVRRFFAELVQQSLQALIMQTLGILATLLLLLMLLVIAILSAWLLSLTGAPAPAYVAWSVLMLLLSVLPAAVPVLMLAMGTFAAIRAWSGQPFQYPVIASLINRWLS